VFEATGCIAPLPCTLEEECSRLCRPAVFEEHVSRFAMPLSLLIIPHRFLSLVVRLTPAHFDLEQAVH